MKIGQKVNVKGSKGRLVWMDNPWKRSDGSEADILVKVSITETKETNFFRLSELEEDNEITQEEMELNEIKKALYKENPHAVLKHIRKGVAYYSAHLPSTDKVIQFEIPVDDMGDADFLSHMDSKLLIRWITI